MVTLALLLSPSTTPLEKAFVGAEVIEDEAPNYCAGSGQSFSWGRMRESMVLWHQASRNFAAHAGELYSQSCMEGFLE